jgi:peptidoglycan/LPS O-acetylase OafA/YrhL
VSAHSPEGLHYRSELDGLRAVAIISVILSHYLGAPFAGGFIGVDIFFVISGYLITSTITSSYAQGKFTLLDFYERRIRRILPALFVVLLASLVAGLFLLGSQEYSQLGKATFATTFLSSNFYYLRQGGYFDAGNDDEPLLHTWTLAVEEQFYFVFPILLVYFLFKFGHLRRILALSVLAAISFALSLILLEAWPSFNYFSAPTRAWELLAGAMLALTSIRSGMSRLPRELLAAAGLVMILLPVVLYDQNTPFPGVAALPPVIGTCMLILYARNTWSGAALSFGPVRYIGLISYSLYLWHWPVLVFWRFAKLDELTSLDKLLAIVVSTICAVISYRFVERPFRDPRQVGRTRLFQFAGLASLALAATSVALFLTDGLAFRVAPSPTIARTQQDAWNFQADICLRRDSSLPGAGQCVLGADDPRLPVTVVLWGDSHAAQFRPALASVGRQLGQRIETFTKAGCPPILSGQLRSSSPMVRDCPAFNAAVMGRIAATPAIAHVVVALRWDAIARGEVVSVAPDGSATQQATQQLLVQQLRQLGEMLRRRGGRLILISQVPLPSFDPLVCARAAWLRTGSFDACREFDTTAAEPINRAVDGTMIDALKSLQLFVIDAHSILCRNSRCLAIMGDDMIYLDAFHLSPQGARLFVPYLQQSLTRR